MASKRAAAVAAATTARFFVGRISVPIISPGPARHAAPVLCARSFSAGSSDLAAPAFGKKAEVTAVATQDTKATAGVKAVAVKTVVAVQTSVEGYYKATPVEGYYKATPVVGYPSSTAETLFTAPLMTVSAAATSPTSTAVEAHYKAPLKASAAATSATTESCDKTAPATSEAVNKSIQDVPKKAFAAATPATTKFVNKTAATATSEAVNKSGQGLLKKAFAAGETSLKRFYRTEAFGKQKSRIPRPPASIEVVILRRFSRHERFIVSCNKGLMAKLLAALNSYTQMDKGARANTPKALFFSFVLAHMGGAIIFYFGVDYACNSMSKTLQTTVDGILDSGVTKEKLNQLVEQMVAKARSDLGLRSWADRILFKEPTVPLPSQAAQEKEEDVGWMEYLQRKIGYGGQN